MGASQSPVRVASPVLLPVAVSDPSRTRYARKCKPRDPIIDDVGDVEQAILQSLQHKPTPGVVYTSAKVTENVTNPSFARKLRTATTEPARHRIVAGLTRINVRRDKQTITYEIVTNRLHVPYVRMCTVVEPTWGADRPRLHPPPWHTYQVMLCLDYIVLVQPRVLNGTLDCVGAHYEPTIRTRSSNMNNAWMESSLHLVKVLVRGRIGGADVGVLIGWMTLEEAVQSQLHAVQSFFHLRTKVAHLSYSVLGMSKLINRASSRYCMQMLMEGVPSRMWYSHAYNFAHRPQLMKHLKDESIYAKKSPLLRAYVDRLSADEFAAYENHRDLLNQCDRYEPGTSNLIGTQAVDFDAVSDVLTVATEQIEDPTRWVTQLLMPRQSDVPTRESISIEESKTEAEESKADTEVQALDARTLASAFGVSGRFEVPDVDERGEDVPYHGTGLSLFTTPDYRRFCYNISNASSPVELPVRTYGVAKVERSEPFVYFIVTGMGVTETDYTSTTFRDWANHIAHEYTFVDDDGSLVTRQVHPVRHANDNRTSATR
jgi:hypothetical protein